MLAKVIYSFYLGLEEILSTYHEDDVELRAKIAFGLVLFLDIFWIATIFIKWFDHNLSFEINWETRFIASILYLVIISVLLRLIEIQVLKTNPLIKLKRRKYQFRTTVWLIMTFFILIPLGIYVLY